MMDSSQWPTLSKPDPEFEKAFDPASDMPDFGTQEDLKAKRPMFEEGMKMVIEAKLDFSGVKRDTIDIPFRDGTSLPGVLWKPETKPVGGSPLAVLYHGGGWIIGRPEMEGASAVELVKKHGAVVVGVKYRFAPEHIFPTGIHDCWDALKWTATNASKLGADPSKGFIIGGSSAGGNIAAVLQHMARDKKLSPPLTGTWMAYPATIHPEAGVEKYKSEYTSHQQNAKGPVLTKPKMDFMLECLQADPKSELFSPLLWHGGHTGIGKTYVQVCGLDPLRDDGLLYDRELRKDGVDVRMDVYSGCPHGFEILLPDIKPAQKMIADRNKAFAWLLNKE